MKKQIKKLSLNKKTISNLTAAEMSNKVGGSVVGYGCGHNGVTKNGKTCLGHKTC